VLLMMKVLEVLRNLCLESFGLVYLENRGLFEQLMKNSDFQQHLGIMKFFASVAILFPDKILNGYSAVIHTLFTCIFFDDFQLLFTFPIHPSVGRFGIAKQSDQLHLPKVVQRNFRG
jgi:Proteasome non-ATPase 26S subunit